MLQILPNNVYHDIRNPSHASPYQELETSMEKPGAPPSGSSEVASIIQAPLYGVTVSRYKSVLNKLGRICKAAGIFLIDVLQVQFITIPAQVKSVHTRESSLTSSGRNQL